MSLHLLMGFMNPITWLLMAMFYIAWLRFNKHRNRNEKRPAGRTWRGAASEVGLGAAFQFFSIAYRPSHAFIAKAQIQQQEDKDEDDDGGPDTPMKHLHRQLRRIRRGEPVERLIWRLE
ncbi:MAG TPA: hypothetical protein VG225_02855 [Terracidiphilus sp.]|nr:hypothetical protein [Terracidiphilus sp.]